MKSESGSFARMEGLSRSVSARAQNAVGRWPRLASVAFVIAFNLLAWVAVALVAFYVF
ncbi:MAG: hypothetical protein OEQ29_06205 [Alphaproteobacteria bacterium]|nr:hypothetical protein [Alphaproteobacteria bacterium]